MVVTREYIVVLPFTCKEYLVAQRWFEARKAPGEVLESETYDPMRTGEHGLHTKRVCSNDNRTPGFIKAIAPAGSLDMHEETWLCSDHHKSVLTNGYLKDKLSINVTTKFQPDTGNTKNIHNLPVHKLKDVERVVIDIANVLDGSSDRNKNATTDLSSFSSVKTGRGKLGHNWVKDVLAKNEGKEVSGSEFGSTPLMCCYVLVEVEVKIFGLQSKLEKTIQAQTKRLLGENFKDMFLSIDKWHDLELSDIDIGLPVTTKN